MDTENTVDFYEFNAQEALANSRSLGTLSADQELAYAKVQASLAVAVALQAVAEAISMHPAFSAALSGSGPNR